jgi:hypothetical protein
MKFKFRFLEKKYFELIKDSASNYEYFKLNNFFNNDKPTKFDILYYNIITNFNKKLRK